MRLKAREKEKKTVLFFLEQYVPAAIGLEDEKVQKRNCPYLWNSVRIYPVLDVFILQEKLAIKFLPWYGKGKGIFDKGGMLMATARRYTMEQIEVARKKLRSLPVKEAGKTRGEVAEFLVNDIKKVCGRATRYGTYGTC